MQAKDGKLYGMAGGGIRDSGAIFSFDPSTSTYTKLKDLDNTSGANPYGSLIQAGNGKLYGMTYEGGSSNRGVIFSFDPSIAVYTKLKDFNDTEGAKPTGSLTEASDGKLYGMTSEGGSNGGGVIFSFDPSTYTYIKLKHLDNNSGYQPYGSLIQASDGKLYGMTSRGGSTSWGVIFSFDPFSSGYIKLKDFTGTDGAYPTGSLIQADNGKLYGMTYEGGDSYVKYYNSDDGVIFSFDPLSSTYKKLRDFDKINGASPLGSLMQTTDGKLYGMTFNGGGGDYGVVFSFDHSSSNYKKLNDFAGNENGSKVSAGLIQLKDGKLYGMTTFGGSTGNGVIFSYDPVSSIYAKHRDFDGTNGANPYGSLIQGKDGILYGVTANGGSHGVGVIFSFDPASSTYTKLKDFDIDNGANPLSSLIQASDGKLYGMTTGGGDCIIEEGGCHRFGVIFSFDLSDSTYMYYSVFRYNKGDSNPKGSFMQASNGKLYGMADHVIFSFDPSSSTYVRYIYLDNENGGDDGLNLLGSLIQATDGKLYGMTSSGGSCHYYDEGCYRFGVIFSFDALSSTYTKLKDFDKSNGAAPLGSLLQASDGKLYGMTSEGGSSHHGVIFSFDPPSSAITKLKDFNGANGAKPGIGSAFIEVKDSTTNTPPTVSLTTPASNATYLAGGNVYFIAVASDADGSVSKVAFYNGATLLYTATDSPYTFKWQKVNTGNYILTAKATDNSGLNTISAPVNISVVPNKPPTVSTVSPTRDQTFVSPANIHLKAVAEDVDGRVTTVEFYSDSTLLTLERKIPYTYDWVNVAAGTYTITARAADNWGAVTISAPVTVTVTLPGTVIRKRTSALKNKANLKRAISLQLAPNPVRDIVTIYTTGLQRDKQAALSIMSATGVIMKSLKITGSTQTVPLDVSLFASGVYTIKLISGERVMHKKLVKL